jgi:hypothetical protein
MGGKSAEKEIAKNKLLNKLNGVRPEDQNCEEMEDLSHFSIVIKGQTKN